MSMKIDKSVFTATELAQYEALIAKAKVDPEAAAEEMEGDIPGEARRRRRTIPEIDAEFEEERVEDDELRLADMDKCRTRKSVSPALAAAMERLETLEKSIEMKEFAEIAKKYAPLGEKEEDLAKTLYEMKKSSEDSYNAYIDILDKSLGIVEKSGIFAEIGKSAAGYGGADTVGKIEAIASDIMKSDTGLTREQAIAKAWEDHPELIAEYDREYKSK